MTPITIDSSIVDYLTMTYVHHPSFTIHSCMHVIDFTAYPCWINRYHSF